MSKCSHCEEQRRLRMGSIVTPDQPYPFHAKDIQVVGSDQNREFKAKDWNPEMYQLLIIVPQAFTPTCTAEVSEANQYALKFSQRNCAVKVVCTDPSQMLREWYKELGLALNAYRGDQRVLHVFSTYELPQKLGLLEQGRAKRASVFVSPDGEVVKIEQFSEVRRNFDDLYRQLKEHQNA